MATLVLILLSAVALSVGFALSGVLLFAGLVYGACSDGVRVCNFVGSDQTVFVVPVVTLFATAGAIVWAARRIARGMSSWWLPLVVIGGEVVLSLVVYVFFTVSTGQPPFFPRSTEVT